MINGEVYKEKTSILPVNNIIKKPMITAHKAIKKRNYTKFTYFAPPLW